jgi:hypothetical protein
MIELIQTKVGKPHGNCFATCLACILELKEIPDISGGYEFANPDGTLDFRYFEMINDFLRRWDLYYFEVIANDVAKNMIKGHHIIVGDGPRGVKHAVVGWQGHIRYDPYPDGGGLLSHDIYGVFACYNPWVVAKEADKRRENQ